MDMITQNAHHRHRMIQYYLKHGATKAGLRYKLSQKTVYKWAARYDGTLESLKDRSHKPHTSPKAHTETEKRLIRKALRRVKWKDLIRAYQMLITKGYTRSYGGFKRIVQQLKDIKPTKRKVKKKPKPYQRACYPGQKVQIDVKYVPSTCVVKRINFSSSKIIFHSEAFRATLQARNEK